MGLPRRKASLHQNWRDARESEKRGISTFERTNSWVARSESLVRDESQDENSLIQDDTTSQDQSVSFILRDSCYLQAMVTFFIIVRSFVFVRQDCYSQPGVVFFSLGPTGRKFRSTMRHRRRRRSFAAVSPVRPIFSSGRLHPDAGAREPSRRIVLFLTILFIMTMNENRYYHEGEERPTSVFCTTALRNASALTRTTSH